MRKTIKYDLEALKSCFYTQNKEDFMYHFNLLKGNLEDMNIIDEVDKNE